MVKNALPKYIDPLRMAQEQVKLTGSLDMDAMPRLKAIVISAEAFTVSLSFGKDEDGRALITGIIEGKLRLECQRCIQPMDYSMHCAVHVSPVHTIEQAKQLPGHWDPVMLENERIQLIEMLEEEILLSMPLIPKHTDPECGGLNIEKESKSDVKRKNPFAKLAVLKKT